MQIKAMSDESGGTGGGHNYNFVGGDPPSFFTCHICTLVARDPQQVSCCYNIYCKTCLADYKKRGREFTCPTCREPLSGKCFKDGRAEREIKALKVYCSNTDSGCQWVGTVANIETHLETCPYLPVKCTNECGEVLRMLLEEHLAMKCPKRKVNCEFCKQKGTHQLITSSSHLDECPDYPVKCSNEECSKKIPRRLLASHNETCPKAVVTCEYNTVGCNKRMKREEKEEHEKESMQHHLQMAVAIVDSFKMALHLKTSFQTQPLPSVPSQVYKLTQYSSKKSNNENWQSPPFYTSPGGYKMKLSIYPNGNSVAKNSHISCYSCLMLGEFDDTLEWPFEGVVTVELLNQLEDKHHRQCITVDESTPVRFRQRVQKDCMKMDGYGSHQFVSHADLDYNPKNKCSYLKDNCLYFRVNAKVKSKNKPWLLGL